MTITQQLMAEGDIVRLNSSDEYQKYFVHMKMAYALILKWYEICVKRGGQTEAEIMKGFAERILYTIQVLSIKFSFSPDHQLALDLNDSGYPHLLGIMELENDLRDRERSLQTLIPPTIQRDRMIDIMLREGRDPTELVWQTALYEYMTSLDEKKVIMPYTIGDVSLIEESKMTRRYLFSWLCYDFRSNVPHVTIMVFDQDKTEGSITENGESRNAFLDAVKLHGSRVGSMLVLARSIDVGLPRIHPKVVKRVKLGPIISKEYSKERNGSNPFLKPLIDFGQDGDLVVAIKHEIITSTGQVNESKGFLASLGPAKIREIFAINLTDEECKEAQASAITRQVILPHHVLQNINLNDEAFGKYADAEKVVYNNEEVIAL